HFTSDGSPKDSSLGSSLDTASDSSSSHSSSDHPSPAPSLGIRSSHQLCSSVLSIPRSPTPATERPSHSVFAEPSHKRSRSPTTFVPVSKHVAGALSFVRADLLPPRKIISSSSSITDLEISLEEGSEPSVLRETDLGMDIDDDIKGSDEPHSESEIDTTETYIEACFAFANIIRGGCSRGESNRGYLRDFGEPERVAELERDNGRLRGTVSVEGLVGSKHVLGSTQAIVLRLFHDCSCIDPQKMPNTRLGAKMTREAIDDEVARRVAEALATRDAAMNLEPLAESGDKHKD
nr:hypothetical protein [Tanacetum cinerariifolium]GFA79435.1 hypothetical protein [Tanacetum cinerariifolium]